MSATLSYDLKKGLSVLTKEHRWDVLTVLILHANIRNRCWVSTDTLTEMATNGNRNKALAAKKWLQAHKVFEIVSYNKRVDDEKKLKPRQHVYQLLGKIQKCEDATCDCQKLTGKVNYLYSESIDGHTFESIPVETFKSIDGETRSIPIRSEPIEETPIHASSDADTPKPHIKRHYFEAVALGVFEVSDFKGLSPASLKRIGLLEKSAKSAIKAHYPDIGDEQGALLISKYCAAEKFKPNLQGQTKFELGLTAFLEKNGAHIPSFLANQTPPPVTSAEPAEYVDPDMVKAAMLAIQEKWNANDKRVAS